MIAFLGRDVEASTFFGEFFFFRRLDRFGFLDHLFVAIDDLGFGLLRDLPIVAYAADLVPKVLDPLLAVLAKRINARLTLGEVFSQLLISRRIDVFHS